MIITKIIYDKTTSNVLSNWIFVINDTQNEFEQRISDKRWPIYKFTRYRKVLRKDDNVIFYMAGSKGKKFLGKGRLASESTPDGMDFFVTLSDVEVWKKPVHMNTVLQDLQLVTNKTNWGLHFQGGVTSLPDGDYKFILSKGN